MFKRILLLGIIYSALIITQAYSNSFDYDYNNNYIEGNESIENGDAYCIPKTSIIKKIKKALVGAPTGYTPQIQPSPYINPNYGPSYMQGFYSGNTWNSHNIYNPMINPRLYSKTF